MEIVVGTPFYAVYEQGMQHISRIYSLLVDTDCK